MSSKPSDLLHFHEGDEGPSHTPFVNLDAEWLWELSESFRGEPEETRLRTIAGRLERLDEQVRNLASNDAYAAGIIEGKRRYLERSNLPVQFSELSPDLRKAIAETSVQPRRITAVPKPKAEAKPTALALAGIKLRFTKED